MAKRVADTGVFPVTGTKPNNSASRKRIRLVAAGLAAMIVWAGATVWGQMKGYNDGVSRLNALNTKLEQTQETNQKLQREIERMSDPEYRQERMRKDMHLSKDGETVFDVPRANP